MTKIIILGIFAILSAHKINHLYVSIIIRYAHNSQRRLYGNKSYVHFRNRYNNSNVNSYALLADKL